MFQDLLSASMNPVSFKRLRGHSSDTLLATPFTRAACHRRVACCYQSFVLCQLSNVDKVHGKMSSSLTVRPNILYS